jgi:hypothetical protein
MAAAGAVETVAEAAAVVAKTNRLDLQIKNVLLTAERFLFHNCLQEAIWDGIAMIFLNFKQHTLIAS